MTDTAIGKPGSLHVLDPIDRNAEILFGLFMVLTFTGTFSVASAGRDEVRTMLWAAIACNTAWGFVDGVMYVLRNLMTRARQAKVERLVLGTGDAVHAHELIAAELGGMAARFDTAALEHARLSIVTRATESDVRPRLTGRDLRGAVGVFLLVFASTFPVVLPFALLSDVQAAKRVSAAIAIAMLYLCGHGWARYAGLKPVRVGLVMVLAGVLVEGVVIALGG
jgi:hypothetical protein